MDCLNILTKVSWGRSGGDSRLRSKTGLTSQIQDDFSSVSDYNFSAANALTGENVDSFAVNIPWFNDSGHCSRTETTM